jgi:hypothetical protein
VQPCVVTLAPVTTRIDVPVSRLFVSELPDAAQVEIELDPETDADIDLLPEVIDLGAVAMKGWRWPCPNTRARPGPVLKRHCRRNRLMTRNRQPDPLKSSSRSATDCLNSKTGAERACGP